MLFLYPASKRPDGCYVLVDKGFDIVRPGDWLVTDELGTRIVRHEAFDLLYEEVKAIESCI